ncbi:MAG: hypothetical protein CO030_01980 [Candidatus Magasanikbacteria bacterium CG_4_9_14_0_2_um_filter_42_11]|uniref:Carbohydrate kinase PfkB domain-containing protein n=1 Tax=Candidatus Magasanikbacteria bacterium CG_4_9_14_0_2_um_filter_42_11 TaxID=1974643 RepID=A0A2M8FA66_9BACT|nr:MAG: hypothetical protein COU34_03485 [Candidatus Magasanikbacteria bacterium CG10_big_fil_rev_8_21_14_0_10_43_9]PIY92132.1 MAG: hypothetical protein COY70_04865 [Candidatus Magasanikbacteria bacterium CG_4_10_14_0_8_um_filter_42_12]PJC52606.1 MAG: hypothetical protein CO030_01980 [Candidatus Magasanikbacteria bacterium CG_4_9_14_0_2_um_filter_42_11]
MFDLITIGDSLVDIFFVIDEGNTGCTLDKNQKKLCFNYAEKMSIEQSTHSVGGNAANVAVGAKKTGLHTAIVTELGDDINGQVVLDALQKAEIDLSLIKIHKNKETRYSVVLNYASERTILSYHAERKYALPTLPDTKWIYYTSLGKHFDILQKQLVSYLKKNPDVRLAMNPGSYQFSHGLETIQQLLSQVSVLIVNKEEAAKLANKTTRSSIPSLLKTLLTKGPHTVVITDGTRGSYAAQGKEQYMMPPYPIKAEAKTGAGDAYTSGFLSAIIHGKDVKEAMMWGTANAGGVIQKFGAQEGLLSKKGILSIIETHRTVHPKKL